MSKYRIQDLIEENGIKILKGSLDSNFFLINDFADIVIFTTKLKVMRK